MRYDDRYREEVVLRDGSRVTLRLVRPDDKALLLEGFERLSPESRYRRFLAPRSKLTDAELVYLTEVDGVDHVAIGALAGDQGVAIGRFIRSPADPHAAEVAVAVVDDWQRKGLGTVLLLRLAAAARERDIERFAGSALPSNEAIRETLAGLDGAVRVRQGPGLVTLEVDLPEMPLEEAPEERVAPLRRLFGMVARGLLLIRDAVGRLAGADQGAEDDSDRTSPPTSTG